jgi:predicted membrane channel-forming protein YqfA (hemolysin III family)
VINSTVLGQIAYPVMTPIFIGQNFNPYSDMYLVAIAWIYVVLMMAVAEALSTQGTVLGAFVTFTLYGLLPLSIVLYLMGTPQRRRQRLKEEAQAETTGAAATAEAASAAPDGGDHAPADAVTPVGKVP